MNFNNCSNENKMTPQERQYYAFPTTGECNRRIIAGGGRELLKNMDNYSVDAVKTMRNIHRFEFSTYNGE